MLQTEFLNSYAGPATYQITVRGKVDKRYLRNFSGMDVSYNQINDKKLSTITGVVPDQSALCGIINFLVDSRYYVESIIKIGV